MSFIREITVLHPKYLSKYLIIFLSQTIQHILIIQQMEEFCHFHIEYKIKIMTDCHSPNISTL